MNGIEFLKTFKDLIDRQFLFGMMWMRNRFGLKLFVFLLLPSLAAVVAALVRCWDWVVVAVMGDWPGEVKGRSTQFPCRALDGVCCHTRLAAQKVGEKNKQIKSKPPPRAPKENLSKILWRR